MLIAAHPLNGLQFCHLLVQIRNKDRISTGFAYYSVAKMKTLMAPRSARQARLLRLANHLSSTGTPGVPRTDGERMVWVNSHIRSEVDKQLSQEEEAAREVLMPLGVGQNAIATHGQTSHGNLFQFREFPMYPGEYVPPQHNTLSSLRDELRMDLGAQSIKQAWMRVSGGTFFQSSNEY